MADVNARQVGGSHYRSDIQHWDFVVLNRLGYLEGCATKYVTRNRKKQDPLTDLRKALHYIEKAQDLNRQGVLLPRAGELAVSVEDFVKANGLNETEEAAIDRLATWQDAGDLQVAWEIVHSMIEDIREAREAQG